MNNDHCARCGKAVPAADTYLSAHGAVCAPCHSMTELSDAAEFQEAASSGPPALPDGHLTHTHVDEDGREYSLTVSAGPLGVLIQLLQGLFRAIRRWRQYS